MFCRYHLTEDSLITLIFLEPTPDLPVLGVFEEPGLPNSTSPLDLLMSNMVKN